MGPLCISIRVADIIWVNINMTKVVSYKIYPINLWKVHHNEITEDINFIFLRTCFTKSVPKPGESVIHIPTHMRPRAHTHTHSFTHSF